MKINSHNEWDKLREIVVGTADGATTCVTYPPEMPVTPELAARAMVVASKAFPQWLIDDVNEDMDDLCRILRDLGVKVLRPGGYRPERLFASPEWSSTGNNLYNMRDLHLVVGNTVVESASPRRHRLFEANGLYDIFYDYFKEDFRWITAPKPRLVGDYVIPFYEDGKRFIRLSEDEILFDAANTLRMGRDLLYLVSSSGNRLGAKWLQGALGDGYRVHTTEGIYRSSHIDSTVMCLRPGLVMFSADRVNESNCPEMFAKWDKIFFSEIAPFPEEIVKFQDEVRTPIGDQLTAMGLQTDIRSMSSPWVGMNFLSVDPQTVLVDARQPALIRTLEKYKFTVVPVRMRYSYIMKGGLHCCTLDTVRDSKLESYFD